MRFWNRRSGLRLKIIAWSFVPTAIILTIVALVGFYAYQQVTEDLTIQSSREVARLAAGQLAAGLTDYSNTLTGLARTSTLYDNNPTDQRAALAQASNRLVVFDGGVVILDDHGTVIATQPVRPEIQGQDWSSRDYFRQIIRVPGTVFSNSLNDGPGGSPVIVVAVPISNGRGELIGLLAGMFRVGPSSVSSLYGTVVRLRIGSNGTAYLVDHNGVVFYDSQSDRIGLNLSALPVVQQVNSGKSDALRTTDPLGRDIVASYSPVPGTPWGLVTEQSWDELLAPGQRYGRFLFLMLVLGLVAPAVVVTIGVRRITQPINRLIAAAEEIASGKFGQQIKVQTGDELEELAKQFNRMSEELSESYGQLEQRVEARTQELATLNSVAALVSGSLDLKQILNAALTQSMETMHMEAGTAFALEDDDGPDEDKFLVLAARQGLSDDFARRVVPRRWGGTAMQQTVATTGQKPAVRLVETYPDPALKQALELEGVKQVINVPLFAKGKLVGAFNLGTRQPREVTRAELELLETICQQIAVAVEYARLYDRAERAAAIAERTRLARELHDSVTQSLYSVTLYAEAAQLQLAGGDHATAAEHLRELRDTAQEALREMRLLIFELRPLALEKGGLASALQARLEAVEERGGIKTELQVEGVERLPPPVQQELYHIAQEALNNVIKHAHARRVRVQLLFSDPSLCLEIDDDGVGFDVSHTRGGLGLAGIRERAERIGGRVEISSRAGKGTQVRISSELGGNDR